jgi:hypothetical protein
MEELKEIKIETFLKDKRKSSRKSSVATDEAVKLLNTEQFVK